MKERMFAAFAAAPGALAKELARIEERGLGLSRKLAELGEAGADAMASYDEAFLSRFVHHSTVLEGSTLTAHQTQLVIEGEFVPSDEKDLADMFAARGSAEGYDFMLREREGAGEFNVDFVLDVHERTALDCQPRTRGVFRNVPVWIASAAVRTADPARVREAMDDLFFMLGASQADPLTKAAAFHAMFELAHPFRDANGRTGRILLARMLLDAGLPPIAVESASKPAYLEALEAWQDGGQREPFIRYVAKRVEREIEARMEGLSLVLA